MNYKYLLYSFLFVLAAFAYYIFNKWRVNVRKEKAEGFYKPDTYVGIVSNWIITIRFAIALIIYFFKAIGQKKYT
jgi:hypothetical protein